MSVLNLYQSVVRLLSNILDAYTAAFFTIDSKARQLNMVSSQSLSKYLDEKASLPLEQSGLLSQVAKVGQTVHIDKISAQEISTTLPFYRNGESHIKGLFAVPVGEGSGILYVDTKHTWGFNDKQRKWIVEIANVLHELLQQQGCLDRQEGYGRILELWHHLDQAAFKGYSIEDYSQLVAKECTQFLSADYGFLAIRGPQDIHFRLAACAGNVYRGLLHQSFSPERGLVGWTFENQKPLFIARLNSDSPDHFLFSPGENLPHQGTFWAVPATLSLGHSLVLSFLTRRPMQWHPDDQYAVTRVLHFFHFIFEQTFWKEKYEQLQEFDICTGLYNFLTFEAYVEATLAASMRSNTPFSLAILQIEPWQVLYTKAPPREIHNIQRQVGANIRDILPSQVVVGQIAENRFGLLFQDMTPREIEHFISRSTDLEQYPCLGALRRGRLRIHSGWASFPQDATRCEDLWPMVYHRLFSSFPSGGRSGQDKKH